MTRRECLALTAAPVALAADAPNFDQFLDSFTAEWMRANPEAATSSRFFPPAEQDALDAKLSPPSAIKGPQQIARAKAGLAALNKFEPRTLNPVQRLWWIPSGTPGPPGGG